MLTAIKIPFPAPPEMKSNRQNQSSVTFISNTLLIHVHTLLYFKMHCCILRSLLYVKMSCVYCCYLSCVYCCSCLLCIVVSCLVCIVVVVLCVLLSPYVYLLYYVCIAVFTLDAGLLARSLYSEGRVTGHLDTGFSWFPCA